SLSLSLDPCVGMPLPRSQSAPRLEKRRSHKELMLDSTIDLHRIALNKIIEEHSKEDKDWKERLVVIMCLLESETLITEGMHLSPQVDLSLYDRVTAVVDKYNGTELDAENGVTEIINVIREYFKGARCKSPLPKRDRAVDGGPHFGVPAIGRIMMHVWNQRSLPDQQFLFGRLMLGEGLNQGEVMCPYCPPFTPADLITHYAQCHQEQWFLDAEFARANGYM
ncbi:hypothetical protein PMAYCL1PPCAC_30587, partial [Pristionchus mayeri]